MTGDSELAAAKAGLQEQLTANRLDGYVDADRVADWLGREYEGEDSFVPTLNMLTGLLDPEAMADPDELRALSFSVLELYNTVRGVKGKAVESREGPKAIELKRMELPPLDWRDEWFEAMVIMNDGDLRSASTSFDGVFGQLLDDHTSEPEVYRLFYNAGMTYYLGGDPLLGRACLNWALELNPNYPMAREALEKVEADGGLGPGAFLGLTTGVLEDIRKYAEENDLDDIKTWSVRRCASELKELGIEFNRREFIEMAKEATTSAKLAEELFYSRGADAADDSDRPWLIVMALWHRLCPEEPATDIISDVLDDVESIENENPFDAWEKTHLEEMRAIYDRAESMLVVDKAGFFEDWLKMYEYRSMDRYNLLTAMTAQIPDGKRGRRVLALADRLEARSGDPLWALAGLCSKMTSGDEDWRDAFGELSERNPHNTTLPNQLSIFAERRGDIRTAHELLLKAVRVADRRREEEETKVSWSPNSTLDDLEFILDRLTDLYDRREVEDERLDLLNDRTAVLEKMKEDMESSDARPEMSKETREKLENDIIERLESTPAGRYHALLKGLGIDFSTEEDVESDIRPIKIGGGMHERDKDGDRDNKRKVGRNEPCPCGSGKKYKKCCLGKREMT